MSEPPAAMPSPELQGMATFWVLTAEDGLRLLRSGPHGLTHDEARRRLALRSAGSTRWHGTHGRLILLLSQFKSPIILILVVAAGLEAADYREFLGEAVEPDSYLKSLSLDCHRPVDREENEVQDG